MNGVSDLKSKDKHGFVYEYFECDCSNPEHVMCVIYEEDEFLQEVGWSEVHFQTQIKPYKGIFRRIWTALKYIWNPDCRCGYWGSTSIAYDDAQRMIKVLENVRKPEEVEKLNEDKALYRLFKRELELMRENDTQAED